VGINYTIGEEGMKVKAIKTIKGKAPMQEYNNYTVLDNDGRENFLACLFPEIEYQEIKL